MINLSHTKCFFNGPNVFLSINSTPRKHWHIYQFMQKKLKYKKVQLLQHERICLVLFKSFLKHCCSAFLQRGVSKDARQNTRVGFTGKQRNLLFVHSNWAWGEKTTPTCCHPQRPSVPGHRGPPLGSLLRHCFDAKKVKLSVCVTFCLTSLCTRFTCAIHSQ